MEKNKLRCVCIELCTASSVLFLLPSVPFPNNKHQQCTTRVGFSNCMDLLMVVLRLVYSIPKLRSPRPCFPSHNQNRIPHFTPFLFLHSVRTEVEIQSTETKQNKDNRTVTTLQFHQINELAADVPMCLVSFSETTILVIPASIICVVFARYVACVNFIPLFIFMFRISIQCKYD